MKELTIEEKAKAYDEALEKAKKLYEKGTITESLNYIFPELKEPNDERIRKALIDFFNAGAYNGEQTNGVYDKDIIAWIKSTETRIVMPQRVELKKEQIIKAAKQREKEVGFTQFVKDTKGVNSAYGIGFLEGAEWANSHLNLTWKDIEKICIIAKSVHNYYGFWCQNVYEEILNRFCKPEIWD